MKRVLEILATTIVLGTTPSFADSFYDAIKNETSNKTEAVDLDESNKKTTKKSNKPKLTLRDEAFQEMLNKTFPLRPDQIVELRKELSRSQQAVKTNPKPPPQPVSSTMTVDLSPGATPPVIRLATGFVTSMVFVDSTGQPWPVGDFSLGNPESFNIEWDSRTNALFVQSVKPFATGNLALRLTELDTPIMISLVNGQKEVDYRVDLQIARTGPKAKKGIATSQVPQGASSMILSVLDGVPPIGSKEVSVSGGAGRAWRHEGMLYFRTKYTLLSPAWTDSVSSLDGTKVYQLVETPLMLVSQNGKAMKIELQGL